MNDDPAGEPTPNPAADGDHFVETPAVGSARRAVPAGKSLLGVAAAALAFGGVVAVLTDSAAHSGWHSVAIGALASGGTLIIQGTWKIRDGRATLSERTPAAGGDTKDGAGE